MNLDCLNDIITDSLAIHIDISDINSWDLNTGFTSISLTQWSNAKSDKLNLYDFGLTAYDNGRVDRMYSGLTLTPQDLKVTLYRVGYNTGQTAFEGITLYDYYPISAVTSGSTVGNYFDLGGGYLQGFFKLQNYNHELFPTRYNNGITIETIIRIDQDSEGIFFLMGARSEDKYNPQFSGESQTVINTITERIPTGVVGQSSIIVNKTTGFTGVQTSENNYLNAYVEEEKIKNAFSSWENMTEQVPVIATQSGNTKGNVIAFGITQNKNLYYKYIDDNNLVRSSSSKTTISSTGWTIINIVFTPYDIIENYDPTIAECYERRKGDLKFFVNGGQFWKISNFDEFFFTEMKNHKEKQLGVPYNISFGGGSYGLKHSWHYDYKTTPIYTGQSQTYIENYFAVTDNPLNEDPCITGNTGGSYNSLGLTLTADTSTFFTEDICDPLIEVSVPVLRIEHTGSTTLYEYFIEFDQTIETLSNRNLQLMAEIYDTGIFTYTNESEQIISSISLIAIGTEDIEINSEVIYRHPTSILTTVPGPFSTYDHQVYEYEDGETSLLIDGQTGYPVINKYNQTLINDQFPVQHVAVGGTGKWNTLQTTFNLKENSNNQFIKVGILLQSTAPLNENFILFVKDFKYISVDKLSEDNKKDNLLIEQNFDSSYVGGIQKLRIYDFAFNSQQVLHNAKMELKNTPNYNYIVSKGGRIIYR